MNEKKKKKQEEELPSDEELLRLAIDGEDELYIASSDDVESTMKIKRARDEWEDLKNDEE